MKKLRKWVPLFAVLAVWVLLGGVVLAIGNPENGVSIGDAYVFGDVLESDDQLYFVRYDVSYDPVPEEDAEDTWELALYDSGGDLVATRPLNYYQHNIISIYLTAEQAIAWGAEHRVVVRGMPSVFANLTEDVNQKTRTLTAGDYLDGTQLGAVMVSQAGILQTDWEITLLTAGDKLNSTGATYFIQAVPGLSAMDPSIFQTTTRDYTVDYENWTRNYTSTLEEHEGEKLRNAVSNVTGIFGVESEAWGGAWLMGLVFLIFGGAVYAPTRNPAWALIIGFVAAAVPFAWLGIGVDLLSAVLLAVLTLAILFGIYFIVRYFS